MNSGITIQLIRFLVLTSDSHLYLITFLQLQINSPKLSHVLRRQNNVGHLFINIQIYKNVVRKRKLFDVPISSIVDS